MMISKRLLALGGCALIATACTQETATAPPPASTEVTVEGIPTTHGSEYGTITFTSVRGEPNSCQVKMALRGLYQDPDDIDYYWVYIGADASPQNDTQWKRVIVNSELNRGAFRGAADDPGGDGLVPKTLLQNSLLYLGLAFYWDSDRDALPGEWQIDRQIVQFKVGGYTYIGPAILDFKVVNRCF